MASIWLWSAAPLMFVAGSRPAGQSPENPVHSSTVSDPPAFGAPLACAWVVEVLLLPPQAATTRPSARAAPPRENLRTVPVEPSLISLTHSKFRYVTITKSSVFRFVLDIRIRPAMHQGRIPPDPAATPALVLALARARTGLVPHPQRTGLRPPRNRRDGQQHPGGRQAARCGCRIHAV